MLPFVHYSHQKPEHRSGACASGRNIASTQQREKECHDELTKRKPPKVTFRVGFRSQKRRHFSMRVVHQRCVPNESEHEEENERRDECEKEFLPIHNFFLLRFAAAPTDPAYFDGNTTGEC